VNIEDYLKFHEFGRGDTIYFPHLKADVAYKTSIKYDVCTHCGKKTLTAEVVWVELPQETVERSCIVCLEKELVYIKRGVVPPTSKMGNPGDPISEDEQIIATRLINECIKDIRAARLIDTNLGKSNN